MKKTLCILMAVFMLGAVLAGCNGAGSGETAPTTVPEATEPTQKDFLKNGIKLSLPGEFEDYSQSPMGQDYTFLYAGPYNGVMGIEDSKDSLPDTVTDLAGYAAYQAEALGGEATQKDGLWTLVYEDPDQNEMQTYVCAFYEGADCYWTVKAYCPAESYQDYQETMWGYVTAVTFE